MDTEDRSGTNSGEIDSMETQDVRNEKLYINIAVENYSNSLLQSIFEMQKKGIFCDVVLISQEGTISAHRLILKSSESQYLRECVILENPAAKCQIFLIDFSEKSVTELVSYLYTGEFKLHLNIVSEMVELFDFLGLKDCYDSLIKFLDSDPVFKLEYEKQTETKQKKKITEKTTNLKGINIPINLQLQAHKSVGQGSGKFQLSLTQLLTKSLQNTRHANERREDSTTGSNNSKVKHQRALSTSYYKNKEKKFSDSSKTIQILTTTSTACTDKKNTNTESELVSGHTDKMVNAMTRDDYDYDSSESDGDFQSDSLDTGNYEYDVDGLEIKDEVSGNREMTKGATQDVKRREVTTQDHVKKIQLDTCKENDYKREGILQELERKNVKNKCKTSGDENVDVKMKYKSLYRMAVHDSRKRSDVASGRSKEVDVTKREVQVFKPKERKPVQKSKDTHDTAKLRDLTKHVETHYTATTYICDIGRCGKKFSTNEFLISHKMNHKARADAKVCIPENGVSAVQSKVVKENNDAAINNSFEQASADTSHSGSSGITQILPYECGKCSTRFSQLRDLEKHVKTHYTETSFICDIGSCGKKFLTKQSLISHKMNHKDKSDTKVSMPKYVVAVPEVESMVDGEDEDKATNSSFEPKLVDTSQPGSSGITQYDKLAISQEKPVDVDKPSKSKKKTRDSGERNHQCEECGKSFKRKDHLNNHMSTHTGEKPWVCEACGKSFTKKAGLQEHSVLHSGNKPYICDICGQTFVRERYLVYHMRLHTGDRPYVCDICGKRFTRVNVLHKHLKSHQNEIKLYSCDVCDKKFADKYVLDNHIKTHGNSKPFECRECGKTFKLNSYLKGHMKIMHTDIRPYTCETCGQGFKTPQMYRRHMYSHMQKHDLPFKCDVCDKRYSEHYLLKKHMKIHDNIRPFKCDKCDKAFPYKAHLRQHNEIHKPNRPQYTCDLCGKTLSNVFSLRHHKKVHETVQFHCHLCNKGFHHKSNFERHMRVHSGLKPYYCEECGSTFTRSNALKKHKAKIHESSNVQHVEIVVDNFLIGDL